ncbi:MAG: hypothetical protein ACR2KX_07490 [Chitinophagaceae bacterium]
MKKILSTFYFFICVITLHAQDGNKQIKPPTRWGITNNYSKSDNGQLMITLPVQAAIVCIGSRSGEAKTFVLRNNSPKELPPGNYDITFWGIKITPVAVEKAKDTRILAGVLNSTVKGLWEIWTADSVKIFSAGGPKQVALPVGNYFVQTHGAKIKTKITDGKVTIFSYTNY